MISIESTKVIIAPDTWSPKMEFTFIVDLQLASDANIRYGLSSQDVLALEIGREVLKQVQFYHTLSKED